jgi:hypothetical protein
MGYAVLKQQTTGHGSKFCTVSTANFFECRGEVAPEKFKLNLGGYGIHCLPSDSLTSALQMRRLRFYFGDGRNFNWLACRPRQRDVQPFILICDVKAPAAWRYSHRSGASRGPCDNLGNHFINQMS